MNKITPKQLSTLFEKGERPEILMLSAADEKITINIHVPASLSWFAGHFPDQAVLPGVVQIDWAGKFAAALYNNAKEFRQLSNIKFKTMVLPETRLTLELVYNHEKNTLKFHYFDSETSYSTGSFTFSA